MSFLRDRSINTKLNLLVGASVVVALGVACGAFVFNDIRMIRASKAAQLSALAKVLGANMTAALEFQDAAAGGELLASLGQAKSVEAAWVYDVDGRLFATYPRTQPADAPVPSPPSGDEARFTAGNTLEITQIIRHGGERVGSIRVRAGMQDLDAQIVRNTSIAAGVTLGALLVSIVLAGRLQRLVTAPVFRLSEVVRRVSQHQDFSLRVDNSSRDEFGLLCDGFNAMLDRIERGQHELQRAHDELEERVDLRTAELSRSNVELTRAIAAAETSNRSKSLFLANMSHEIRTPMTAILGYLDLIADLDTTDDERNMHVRTIRRNARHLLGVINDILDVSKIEAGKMQIERIPCSVGAMVAELASLMRGRAKEQNLDLDVEYQGAIPESILTDPTRLRQILTNLIGNAIKFTEQGGVRLVVRMADAPTAANPRIGFEIIDTGMGMTADQLQRIFKPFSQANESMTRRFGGTGLGLTISRRLTDMLGGDITVESRAGQGSSFLVTIETGPLDGITMLTNCRESEFMPSASQPAPIPSSVEKPLAGLDVLLAEDGADNQLLIASFLRKAGADVQVVENGLLCLEEALRAEQAGEPYDTIISDMQMPVMDGYTSVRRLRQRGYRGPIIAITAHAMTSDRDKCIDAGCDDYTTKPVDRRKLIQLVEWYGRKRHESEAKGLDAAKFKTASAEPSW